MNVKELKEILNQYPDDMPVGCEDERCDWLLDLDPTPKLGQYIKSDEGYKIHYSDTSLYSVHPILVLYQN